MSTAYDWDAAAAAREDARWDALGDEPDRRSDACRCGNDMPGMCPGPDHCPMCEIDDDEVES